MAKLKAGEMRVELTIPADLELRLRKIALESDPPRRTLTEFLRDLMSRAEPLRPLDSAVGNS